MPGRRRSRGARNGGSSLCCISRQSIARKLQCERRSWRSIEGRHEDETFLWRDAAEAEKQAADWIAFHPKVTIKDRRAVETNTLSIETRQPKTPAEWIVAIDYEDGTSN
jgi:hypothetical protein